MTKLPKRITDRPKLPAGTATSQINLIHFTEYADHSRDLSKHYQKFTKVFEKQPDMALGLGLFEALHIIEPHHKRNNYSIESLIEEVLA